MVLYSIIRANNGIEGVCKDGPRDIRWRQKRGLGVILETQAIRKGNYADQKFVLMYDLDGTPDHDLFVLYGTPESVQERVRETIALAEKHPFEETPPEVIGEIEINPTEELAKQLDDAYKYGEGTDMEQNLFGVFAAFA